jgi:hypothetical protein
VTLASAFIDRTRRELLSGVVEQQNKLATTVTSSDTTWTFTYALNGIQAGVWLECELEQVYVWETNDSAKTATVERAVNGTTAAAHTAPLLVGLKPRFPRASLLDNLNYELADLAASGLYRMRTLPNIAYDSSGEDIPLAFTGGEVPLSIYAVRYESINRQWPMIRSWELIRDQDTTDFPTGFALRLHDCWPTGDLRVQYKAPFGTVSALSDDLAGATIGLPTTADDLVMFGMQMRVMAGREVKRNFTESQGDTRRAEEVPAGAVGNSYRGLERLRQLRLIAEVNRLQKRYPEVMFV